MKKKKSKQVSFIKIGIQKRIDQAQRQAYAATSCDCPKGECAHGDPVWLQRIERLQCVRGAMAVALIKLPAEKDFWKAVDGLPRQAVAKPRARPTAPSKSGTTVSLKTVIRELQRKAKQKVSSGSCGCAPWDACGHDPGDQRTVWAARLRKLNGLSVEAAQPLLPHAKTSLIWEAVDRLADDRAVEPEEGAQDSGPVC